MYFCYLLKSNNEKHLNDTYIGFTDDPLHRLRQHNGEIKGGAKYTSKRRPWEIVLVVANFPNKILALKFEWAWQNPFQSTFIKDKIDDKVPPKTNKKKFYNSIDFKIRVFNCLISSKVFDYIYLYAFPFRDLGDAIQYKKNIIVEQVTVDTFKEALSRRVFYYDNNENLNSGDFEFTVSDKCIICDVTIQKKKDKGKFEEFEINDDSSENENNNEGIISCPFCKSKYHMLCLAANSIQASNDKLLLIPRETQCLICLNKYLWNEWIKSYIKNY